MIGAHRVARGHADCVSFVMSLWRAGSRSGAAPGAAPQACCVRAGAL